MGIITILLNNWKPIAVALAVLVLSGYFYKQGMDSVQAEWDLAISKQNERNLKVNQEVSNDYQKKLTDLRKRYDALRLHTSGSVSNANPASGFNAGATTEGLSGCVGEGYSLMYQADVQTQQLIALQHWINEMR